MKARYIYVLLIHVHILLLSCSGISVSYLFRFYKLHIPTCLFAVGQNTVLMLMLSCIFCQIHILYCHFAILKYLQLFPSSRLFKRDMFYFEIWTLIWALIWALSCTLCVFSFLLTLTLPGPSAGVSGSLDSYCSLKPLCSGMGEVVPARTSPTLLPPSPRTVLSLSCFKVSQCINCRD